MNKSILAFLIGTFLLTIAGLLYLLGQNNVRFITGGISLARLTPIFLIPTFVAVVSALVQKQGFDDFALRFSYLKKYIWYFVIPLILLIVSVQTFAPHAGHLGGLIMLSILIPILLVACLGSGAGWYGYFASQIYKTHHNRRHSIVALIYSLWFLIIYFVSLGSFAHLSWLSLLAVTVVTLLSGFAGSFLREKTQSAWLSSALQMLHIFLVFSVLH